MSAFDYVELNDEELIQASQIIDIDNVLSLLEGDDEELVRVRQQYDLESVSIWLLLFSSSF